MYHTTEHAATNDRRRLAEDKLHIAGTRVRAGCRRAVRDAGLGAAKTQNAHAIDAAVESLQLESTLLVGRRPRGRDKRELLRQVVPDRDDVAQRDRSSRRANDDGGTTTVTQVTINVTVQGVWWTGAEGAAAGDPTTVPPTDGAETKKDEEVIDAEFEVKE